MLLVTLFDIGEDVQMSRKNTSSLVEDVRLSVSEKRLTSLSGSDSCVRTLELSHSRDWGLEGGDESSSKCLCKMSPKSFLVMLVMLKF